MISGEITTKTYVDFPSIVRNTIKDIGYTRAKYGFDSETCAVISSTCSFVRVREFISAGRLPIPMQARQ